MQEGRNLQLQIYCGRLPPFSGSTQVDAAAEVEEDEVLCSGGGARAAVGLREEEDARKGRMRKDLDRSICKGRLISGREKRGGRKYGYPASRTPRFLGWSLR